MLTIPTPTPPPPLPVPGRAPMEPPPEELSPAAPMPIPNASPELVRNVTESLRLATRASELLAAHPPHDTGTPDTKDARIRIYNTTLAAQKPIERQLSASSSDAALTSVLRQTDATLEDVGWQLQNKPSPDGRFTGVDIAGAQADTREGVRLLTELLASVQGTPAVPGMPAIPTPQPPPGWSTPAAPSAPTPPAAPVVTPPATPAVPPSSPPASGGAQDDYPSVDDSTGGGQKSGGDS